MFNNIKQLRKELKLNQTEFAKKIGVAMRTVQEWEADKVVLKESSLRLIESTFNVNPQWLRTGTGEMFLAPKAEDASPPRHINLEFVRMLINTILTATQNAGVELPPDKVADLVILSYEQYFKELNEGESKIESISQHMQSAISLAVKAIAQ